MNMAVARAARIVEHALEDLVILDSDLAHQPDLALQQAGVEVAIISGRSSRALELRALNLGIEELHMGVADKRTLLTELAAQRAIELSQTGYMGDDVVDLPVLRACGFSATVADGHGEVRSRVDYVATKGGGRGAVREVCDLIIRARGKWDAAMAEYLA